jgi:hypothetical protein
MSTHYIPFVLELENTNGQAARVSRQRQLPCKNISYVARGQEQTMAKHKSSSHNAQQLAVRNMSKGQRGAGKGMGGGKRRQAQTKRA